MGIVRLVKSSKDSRFYEYVDVEDVERGLRNGSIKRGYEDAWAPDENGIARPIKREFLYKE